jgi:hypothetical protein
MQPPQQNENSSTGKFGTPSDGTRCDRRDRPHRYSPQFPDSLAASAESCRAISPEGSTPDGWSGASVPRFHFESCETIAGVSSGLSWYVATLTTSHTANIANPIKIDRTQEWGL